MLSLPRKLLSLLCVSSLLMFSSQASAAGDSCDKIVVSGAADWLPFSYKEGDVLKGVGVDLAYKLFAELDIPVEVILVERTSELGYLLRHGEVDLVVGTYDIPEYRNIAMLLTPAYFDDMVSIVVPSKREFAFNNWHALKGKVGMTTKDGQLDNDFASFADNNLHIKKADDLRFVLKNLKNKHIDYAVGSRKHLEAGVSDMDMQGDVTFIDNKISSASVHFGFSKVSACGQYAPYIKMRLNELKNSGEVDKLISKYMQKKKSKITSEKKLKKIKKEVKEEVKEETKTEVKKERHPKVLTAEEFKAFYGDKMPKDENGAPQDGLLYGPTEVLDIQTPKSLM